MKRTALAVAAAVAAAGCSPTVSTRTVNGVQTTTYTHPELLGAAALDPQDTNWKIQVSKLDEAHYRIDLRMNPITIGGVGEAEDLFHRQAGAIAAQTQSSGYLVLSWNEGIESQFPIARRWARGVIQVQPAAATSGRP